MAYTSVPLYLDPPNWPQQQQTHQQGGSINNSQLPQPPPPPSDGAGPIRLHSTADQTRLLKAQQPESSQKCPRCESTNTKFCYFNNYSLSQPRHFCKTCRRYWTRGGALRNVPVGGGCRRNKRSKGNSSKSQVSASSAAVSGPTCTTNINIGHIPQPPLPSQFPLFASLHHLSDYGTADAGLNFGGLQRVAANGGSEFQMIGESGGASNMMMSGPSDRWRSPFFAGFELPPGLYNPVADQISGKPSSSEINQLASVKTEGNHGFNLSRQFLGAQGNDPYWGGGSPWTDLSGFTSSSH